MSHYHSIILAKELGAGQELLILGEGDDRLRQLSEIKLQEGRYGMDVCVTVGKMRQT